MWQPLLLCMCNLSLMLCEWTSGGTQDSCTFSVIKKYLELFNVNASVYNMHVPQEKQVSMSQLGKWNKDIQTKRNETSFKQICW